MKLHKLHTLTVLKYINGRNKSNIFFLNEKYEVCRITQTHLKGKQ
jgi:hypothetical protein